MNSHKVKPAREDVFRSLPVPLALRIMILPSVISQLIVLIYNMADTFYVGQTNNPYMVAATSLILPVFNISICIAGLAGVGGGSLVSRLLGQGREDEARRVGTFSIYLGLSIAALFALAMGLFMRPILGLLGAGENTYDFAKQYAACVIVAGGIPTVLSNVLSNLLRSIGRSTAAGFGIVLGGVLNIVLDPLFMFVLLPKGQEVLGAGVATCISNCVACAYFIVVVLRSGKGAVVTFSPRVGLAERSSISAVFAVGVPSAVTSFLFDLDYVILDRLMTSYNDLALAAIGIVLKVERFPLNVGVGICQGMMPLVGYNYSAGNRKRLRDTMRLSLGLGLVIAAVSILLYELFATPLIRLFLDDAETVRLASSFLRACACNAAYVHELFYGVSVPGIWKGQYLAAAGNGALAGIQYPHAVPAEPPRRYVRACLVPGHRRQPERHRFDNRIPPLPPSAPAQGCGKGGALKKPPQISAGAFLRKKHADGSDRACLNNNAV